jgi:hypothetical protein
MTRRTPEDARHEAAHAVVGVYLGLRLHAVRLVRDEDFDGYAYFYTPPTLNLHAGIMFAAGAAADALHGRRTPTAWEADFELIAESGFSARERRVLIDIATRYLRGPCARAWATVTEALLERDLTGPEIKALVMHGEPLEVDA